MIGELMSICRRYLLWWWNSGPWFDCGR